MLSYYFINLNLIIMFNKKGYIQFIVLGIFLLLITYLLIVPTQNKSMLGWVISGNENSATISEIAILNTQRPLFDLFSQKNPIGIYKIDLQILDKNRQIVLYGNLSNVGMGLSYFSLGSNLEGVYTIRTTLYYNGKIIESTKEKDVQTIRIK